MVTNAADIAGLKASNGAFARLADRWIYVFMAGLFFATALVGFLPDSFGLLAAVKAGQRPPLPPILHVHAALMGTWLSLLLVQTTLVATGRRAFHQQLGLAAMVIAPAIVVAMITLVRTTWLQFAAVPPGAMPADDLKVTKFILTNLVLEQGRVVILFATFVGWALAVRRTDPEEHKRLLILATVLPLPAAIDRMTWLYSTMPARPTTAELYMVLWLLPVLAYDLIRRGSVHRAYVIGIGLNLPFFAVSQLLWGSAWWAAAAPKLMGVANW